MSTSATKRKPSTDGISQPPDWYKPSSPLVPAVVPLERRALALAHIYVTEGDGHHQWGMAFPNERDAAMDLVRLARAR